MIWSISASVKMLGSTIREVTPVATLTIIGTGSRLLLGDLLPLMLPLAFKACCFPTERLAATDAGCENWAEDASATKTVIPSLVGVLGSDCAARLSVPGSASSKFESVAVGGFA